MTLILPLIAAAVGSAQTFDAKDLMLTKRVFVMLRPEVRTELKLTKEQESKVKTEFGSALTEVNGKFSLAIRGDTNLVKIDVAARKHLLPEQSKRLDEIWLQHLGGCALADQDTSKQLKLTDAQVKRISDLLEEAGRQYGEVMFSNDPESESKLKGITRKAGELMVSVLTVEQKKQFDAMKGKEFKFVDPKAG